MSNRRPWLVSGAIVLVIVLLGLVVGLCRVKLAPVPAPATATPTATVAATVAATGTPEPALGPVAPEVTATPTLGAYGSGGLLGSCRVHDALPDQVCTPGGVLPVTTAQVCRRGYAGSVRNVSKVEKELVFREYGILAHESGQFEVDHLVSLELGGSNDISNLWPEAADPRPGFHEKDHVENVLHAEVCAGHLDLATAQKQIAANWLLLYQEMKVSP